MQKDKGANSTKRTASHAGFHFVNLYQCCPMKFYLRYIEGLAPKVTSNPLILGSAFHEAKAAWYLGKTQTAALSIGLATVEEAKGELKDDLAYNEIQFRLKGLFPGWLEQFGKRDRAEYKILAVEKEIKLPIVGTKFVMTMRPDAIVQGKATKLIIVMETKTSGFSHRITSEAVYYGDQATSYILGAQKVLGFKVYGVQPDIAYWNSQTRDPSNRKFLRTDIVFRDQWRLDQFEQSMGQLFAEITQKANALQKGFTAETLFPRNSYYCLSFSHPCEYVEICGKCLKDRMVKSTIKQLFRVDSKPKNPGQLVADEIAVV
jgi:hypothetical protein